MFRVVVPARHDSSRLAGKVLLPIAGRTMLEWVLERARASSADEVWVATDDERIARVARDCGAPVAMTSTTHALRNRPHRRGGVVTALGPRAHHRESTGR